MSDKGVCRTAPATPGLLKRVTFLNRKGRSKKLFFLFLFCVASTVSFVHAWFVSLECHQAVAVGWQVISEFINIYFNVFSM